jgi:hypothetical protein
VEAFALLPLAAVSTSAQEIAHVNLPFAFVADHVALPAGRYEVLASDSSLTFINLDTCRAQAMLMARKEPGDRIAAGSALEFYVIGNRHVLTEVQFAGSSYRSELLSQPKREHLTAGNTKHNGDAIEIAMN